MNKLPDFMIIGAGKCGTTSLFNYLNQHPQIYLCSQKETYYFIPEPNRSNLKQWGAICDFDSYQSLFKDAPEKNIVGEISTVYYKNPNSAQLIYEVLPEVKILAILRDPAHRAFSNYQMYVRNGNEKQSFRKIIEPNHRYIKPGFYYKELIRYYEIFPAEQIKILFYEDLCKQPVEFIQDIFSFIGVDYSFVPDMSKKGRQGGLPKNMAVNSLLTNKNPLRTMAANVLKFFFPSNVRQNIRSSLIKRNTYKAKLNQSDRQKLIELYRDDILKLQELTGRDLSGWLK